MLDALLLRHGIAVTGGTPLFRFVEHPQAGDLFHTLGEHGILVRRFDRLANCLRFGLPAGEAEMARLDQALTGWRKTRDVRPMIYVCPLSRIEETVAAERRAPPGDADQCRHAGQLGQPACAATTTSSCR